MIITIARQCGCCGDEIGRALSDVYHIPFYDRRAIADMARDKGLYERYPDFYGETPMNTLMYTISEDEDLEVFHETPKKALNELIGDEDCIVLGRCGNYAFQDREDLISVFLTGNDTGRYERISMKHGIDWKSAKKLVVSTDERRGTYHKYYTGQVWGMAGNYNLCLDISSLGNDGAVKMIEEYIRQIG